MGFCGYKLFPEDLDFVIGKGCMCVYMKFKEVQNNF